MNINQNPSKEKKSPRGNNITIPTKRGLPPTAIEQTSAFIAITNIHNHRGEGLPFASGFSHKNGRRAGFRFLFPFTASLAVLFISLRPGPLFLPPSFPHPSLFLPPSFPFQSFPLLPSPFPLPPSPNLTYLFYLPQHSNSPKTSNKSFK